MSGFFKSLLNPSKWFAPIAVDISQEDLINKSKNDNSFVLLDVRTKKEFAKGHIEGAQNISHTELHQRLNEVPTDKDVILYCRSGVRVGVAAKILSKNGYTQIFHLDGDMIAWNTNNRPVVIR